MSRASESCCQGGGVSLITSLNNPQVKRILHLNQKTKARRQEGLFVAEGEKMFLEAPVSWIDRAYVSEEYVPQAGAAEKLSCVSSETVGSSVFRQMSDTCTPQGVLTVLKTPVYGADDLLSHSMEHAPLFLILEDIQDPGNLGSMIRSGEGAGVDGVLLTKTCADVTSPKAVRATMGSVYRIPYLWIENIEEAGRILRPLGVKLYAAYLKGGEDYDRMDYSHGCAFLIGNEGKGLTLEAVNEADKRIRIPMCGRVESLNAAMAASILMYEAARQRREKHTMYP